MQIDQSENAATLRLPSKIVPLRPESWLVEPAWVKALDSDRGRHFLKFTLPAIPVTVFTLTFLLCYFIEVNGSTASERSLDPTPALLAAASMTIIIGTMCIGIYSGFRHIMGLDNSELR